METMGKKSSVAWPILIVGACGVLILFACVLAAALGTGGYLLMLRTSKSEQSSTVKLTPQTAAVEDLRGWVEVQSAEGAWNPAAADQILNAGQHVRTGSLSSASLVFYDGSRVTLQADSELSIDKLDAQKPGKQRTIVLTQLSGRSSHKVTTNKLDGSRYDVNSPTGSGQAKGTEFEVIVTPDQTAYYVVTEGVVAVTGLQTTVEVLAGQVTTIFLNQAPIQPVMSASGEGVVSQTGDSWIIAGQTFKTDENTAITGEPKIGDWVQVMGHLLADGTKAADWIILVHVSPTNQFNLTGTVESASPTEWKVNGQTILVAQATLIDPGIIAGDTVRVEGQVLTGGKLQADRIQKIDSETKQPFAFTGLVQEIGDPAWMISGIKITVDSKTLIAKDLKAGDLVEAKGAIKEDGSWLASSIQPAEDGQHSFAFTGTLESKAPWKAAGIAFETRDWTEIQSDLKVGDQVRVEGEVDSNGTWIASQIERVDETNISTMILIGTVFGTNPWIISGIPVQINNTTVVDGEIKVGMLVRVEIRLQADGSWLVVRIQRLTTLVWFPGCVDVVATVVSVDGKQVQLLDWPMLQLDDQSEVQGVLAPNSVVRLRVCFAEDMTIRVTYIIIVQQATPETPEGENNQGGKVLVCHKPGKKGGGHTLSISASALPAHLGHGDYAGACR